MGKIILVIGLFLLSSSSHAFHSTLTCKEITDFSNVVTLRVKNKFLKRMDRDVAHKTTEAPILFFDRYNDDKTYMIYVSDTKTGYEIALPTREWEPKNEYQLDVVLKIAERAVIDRVSQKKVTKYKCITAPTLTGF